MAVNVYLVGKTGANKANSYELMTNSLEVAREAVSKIPHGEMKVIKVQGGQK